MKYLSFFSAAVMAVKIAPDVFGPEGENYINNNAEYDMSLIGIDIQNPDKSAEKC